MRSLVAFAVFMIASSQAGSLQREKRELKEDCKDEPIELGIVLDSSSSIWGPDFELAKTFLKDVVSDFIISPNGTRVSLILFGDGIYTNTAFGLTKYSTKDEVLEALTNTKHQYGGYTSTYEGIDYMRNVQFASDVVRPEATRICVVLTDGNSQKTTKTAESAAAAVNAGINMIAIGVGSQVNDQELINIAGGNVSRVIRATKFSELEWVLEPLHEQICVPVTAPPPPPTTTPAPTTPAPTTTTTTTTTEAPTTPVTLAAPTELPQTQACGDAKPADVYFVFSQGALGLENTVKTSEFVTRVVESDEVKSGYRYGVISDSCAEGFDIGTFDSAGPVVARMEDYTDFQLPGLVKKLVHKGYPIHGEKCDTGKKTSKVAVIFSSADQKGIAGMEQDVKALVGDGVKVYLVDLSGENVAVAGATTLSGAPPKILADEFINKMCTSSEE